MGRGFTMDEFKEAYEERMAIMTIDGGLTEEEAAPLAMECIERENERLKAD